MNWERAVKNFADAARPSQIYFLGLSISIAPFMHADFALAGLSAAAFGGLIGARSFENITQTKADVQTKKSVVEGATATTRIAAEAVTADKKIEADLTKATQGANP